MNKKYLSITMVSIAALFASILSTATANSGELLLGVQNGQWVHYAQKDPTSTEDGIREYWVQCGGDYQFSAPKGVKLIEATSYDTTGFSENDPRWIKTMDSNKAVFYDLANQEINSCELGVSGYTTTTAHGVNAGDSTTAIFTKDDNSCWYYGNYLTVTEVINDGDTLKNRIWMPNKTSAFTGYYVLSQDMEGFTYSETSSTAVSQVSLAFAGTLDGRGHTVNNITSSYKAGIFGTSSFYNNGSFGYLKNITFTNFGSCAYGLLGYTACHLHTENVSIYARNNVYYLLGGCYTGAMSMKDCYFDISLPGTMRIFGQRYSSSTAFPSCDNVKINNDLSKTHVFYGNVTEEYKETGIIWSHPNIVTKDNEVAYYRLKDNVLCTSELSSDLDGYQLYGNYYGTEAVDFSGKSSGSEQIIYALKDNAQTYAIKCLVVSDAFETQDEFLSWSKNRTNSGDSGYYVLCCDISYPSANVMSGAYAFTGTFDGLNHTITYSLNYASNYGLFGQLTSGGIVKNLNIDGINQGYAIGWSVWDGNIINCSFAAAETIQRDNVALVANSLLGKSTLENVTFDNKTNDDTVIANNRGSSSNAGTFTFSNVTVKCLKTCVMFKNVYDDKPVNPTEIDYDYSSSNVVDYSKGVAFSSAYKVRYVSGDDYIARASEMLVRNINQDDNLGFDVSRSSISSSDIISSSTKAIIIGSTASFWAAGFSMDGTSYLNESGYVIKTKDNAVYIMAVDYRGYQLAVNKLLDFILGFDCLGLNTYIYSRDGSVIPYISYENEATLIDRKCDAYYNDYHRNDAYSMNYNINANHFANFTASVYTDASGTLGSVTESTHTAMLILPAPTYYATHRTWYGVYNGSWPYSDGMEKTSFTGALCYTARGNEDDYKLMVQTFAENILTNCEAKNNYIINVGNSDGDGYCKCSTCCKHNPSYNFVSFLNDVDDYIVSQEKSVKIYFSCYKAFLTAPDDDSLKCNDNVIPYVAPINANYYEPLNSEVNATYKTALEKWAKISSDRIAWIYDTNFSNLLYPFASYEVTCQNIKYLASLGYSMAWPQDLYSTGEYGSMTGFTALKYYVESKFMENTNSDYDALVDKFFANYYGEGGDKMRIMFNELNAFIQKRYSDGTKSEQIGSINDNAGDMNDNTTTGKPEHAYVYNWQYEDILKWRGFCNDALELVSDSLSIEHIKSERIFVNWCLATLFSDEIKQAGLSETINDELVRDCNDLNIVRWKESSSIYNGGSNNLNDYFVEHNMCLKDEKLVYNTSTKTLDDSGISSLLTGYSYYSDGNKTAINWDNVTSGETLMVYAMKDNQPTYIVKVVCQ